MSVNSIVNVPVEIKNKSNVVNEKTKSNNVSEKEVDEEKSNATKYMLGATIAAGVIALGVIGHKNNWWRKCTDVIDNSSKKDSTALSEGVGGSSKKGNEALTGPNASSDKSTATFDEKLGETSNKEKDVLGETNSNPKKETATPEAEPKLEQDAEINAEKEAQERAKAEADAKLKEKQEAKAKLEAKEKAFIETHKQEAIDKLMAEGDELWGACKKYDGLIRKFARMQQEGFEAIRGQKSVKDGRYVVVQNLGICSKTSINTVMTYYSTDGKVIDEIVRTRNGKKAYEVSFRDNGKTVELEAGNIYMDGNKDGLVGVRTNKDHVSFNVYKDGKYCEISRQDFSSDELEQIILACEISGKHSTTNKIHSFGTTESSLRKYLNITD